MGPRMDSAPRRRSSRASSALGREPAPKELDSFRAFLQKQTDYHTARSKDGAELAALTDLAHVMLNTNEFVYIN